MPSFLGSHMNEISNYHLSDTHKHSAKTANFFKIRAICHDFEMACIIEMWNVGNVHRSTLMFCYKCLYKCIKRGFVFMLKLLYLFGDRMHLDNRLLRLLQCHCFPLWSFIRAHVIRLHHIVIDIFHN